MQGYRVDHGTNGWEVRKSEKGWIVEEWSHVQGCTSGLKVLIPFLPKDDKNDQLDTPINDAGTLLAEVIKHEADCGYYKQVLRYGHIVE